MEDPKKRPRLSINKWVQTLLSFIFQSIPFSKFSQTPKPNIFLMTCDEEN